MNNTTSSGLGSAALLAAAGIALPLFVQAAAAGAAPASLPETAVFAEVDGTVIAARDYEAALNLAAARRFYHRQPPEEQLAAFRREVADALINRALFLAEAARRGIEPDRERVRKALAEHDQRYRDSAQWQENRAELLPKLQRQLEDQSVLETLEQSVRATSEPGEAQLHAYYKLHAELFTEPEQLRLSLILLKVDPSSPRAAWDKAREEARAVMARLARGADFGELARTLSGDGSAERGGDMGYLHRGMLPEAVYAEAAKLAPSAVSEPVTVLEGIALVRLEDRRAAQLRKFEEVRSRAAGLWRREQAGKNWEALATALRKTARIRIDPVRFPELGALGGGRAETGR